MAEQRPGFPALARGRLPARRLLAARPVGVPGMLAVVSACLALAGCTSGRTLFGGRGATDSNRQEPVGGVLDDQAAMVDTGGLAVYLNTMLDLITGDSLTRAATFSDARDAAEFAPTKINRLRYALALSVPDHGGSDAVEAARRLRELLAAGDTLSPAERRLAMVQLHQAEQLTILETASIELNQRLADTQAALDSRTEAENNARIQALQAQISSLQTQLDDANQMLDAITNIEQTISEREDNDD